MFDNFAAKFTCERGSGAAKASPVSPGVAASGLDHLLEAFSGCSFNRGLYRIHASADMAKWSGIVGDAFPDYRTRIFCFGYDWLGRHFALDRDRTDQGEPLILLLEPGTGEVLDIPAGLLAFHNEELVEYANEALAEDFFKSWLQAGNRAPEFGECVGYGTPLFLGGDDTVENLELTDMDVYWDISGQLIGKVKGLPPGTRIDDISIG